MSVIVERQVHGYRQGHQLLAASSQCARPDQSVLDRLSDVAGPLRPRESFQPYLSVYPLPSGQRVVLAKTWQDTFVARAGCVRTLSLVIGADDWASAQSLSPFLELLETDGLPGEENATRREVTASSATSLPPTPDFNAGELLEAIFLEQQRPVVVFDASAAELIALRLLTSLWPSMRRRFALSTFALAPRKVSGRDFDLVFAPLDAKGKFSDWNGRRIDGRSMQESRHRWTGAIVSRVFEQPHPRLLSAEDSRLVGGDDVDDASALRIALVWDELFSKLERTPAAILGLLDIANSGKVHDSEAIRLLEPALASAVRTASTELPETEAWEFLGAIAAKMRARPLPAGRQAMEFATEALAARSPEGAVALLDRLAQTSVAADLLPKIAHGLGRSADVRGESALLSASHELLLRLIAADERLSRRVAFDDVLVNVVGETIGNQGPSLVDAVRRSLLPHLINDRHLPAARPLVATLSGRGLATEIAHLGAANDFEAHSIAELVVERARAVGAKEEVRASIIRSHPSTRRNALLAKTIDPTADDVAWLIGHSNLPNELATELLISVLRGSDREQLAAILRQHPLAERVLVRVESGAPDLLERAVLSHELQIDPFVRAVDLLLLKANGATSVRVADEALRRCLTVPFNGDEKTFVSRLMGIVGEELDGAKVIRIGIGPDVSAPIASRNMIAFQQGPRPARFRIVEATAELARTLIDRRTLDLDSEAWEACAHLVIEAATFVPRAQLDASGLLLPMLMRHPRQPISPLVAATFPVIYRELAKGDDLSDLLKFIPFLDWDRCKAARRELVSTFMSSQVWAPADLALTAYRCGDIDRILRRVANSYGGEEYIQRLESQVMCLPDECKEMVENAIRAITNSSLT